MINKSEYYIDIDAMIEQCKIVPKEDRRDVIVLTEEEIEDIENIEVLEDTEGTENFEDITAPLDETSFNYFKYETFKTLLTRFIDSYPGDGDQEQEDVLLNKSSNTYAVDVITNTFIHYNILKKFNTYE